MRPRTQHDNPLDIDYEPRLPPEEKRRTALVIAFILLSVALAAAAQLTLKFGVDRVTEHGRSGIILGQPLASALRVVREPFVWGGLFLFALSAAVWIVVLSRTALSFAYPFAALTYVLILLADRIFLGVDVPALRWAGVALIVGGIILISRTGHAT